MTSDDTISPFLQFGPQFYVSDFRTGTVTDNESLEVSRCREEAWSRKRSLRELRLTTSHEVPHVGSVHLMCLEVPTCSLNGD